MKNFTVLPAQTAEQQLFTINMGGAGMVIYDLRGQDLKPIIIAPGESLQYGFASAAVVARLTLLWREVPV